MRSALPLFLFLSIAHAESPGASVPAAAAPAPASTPAPVVTEIVVTGERAAVENRVDRKVYTVSGDVQATIGSATDVLRNIPSVSLDVEGNPSLRGDPSVEIYIDGRPAAEFNGPSRGAALEQLSADQIERIEVITNPPANFKREGTGGIINIVMKRTGNSRTASARASLGSNGRYTGGTSQGVRNGKLALRASAYTRHDLRIREFSDDRVLRDADTGDTLSGQQTRGGNHDVRQGKVLNLGADYDATEHDRFGAEAQLWRRDARTHVEENKTIFDGVGAPESDTLRVRRSNEYEYVSEVTLNYHHSGATDGDGVEVNLHRADYRTHQPWRFTDSDLLAANPDLFEDWNIQQNELTTEFSVEGTRTFESKARLITGYDLERLDTLENFGITIPVPAGQPHVPDADQSTHFTHTEDIHALYASWEQPLGKWTALGGLRLEQAELEAARDYFRAYPSVHVARPLDEHNSISFSYSRRVTRPNWQDLNPAIVRQNSTALRQGNPALEPSEVDSLEAGWNWEQGRSSLSATVYARRSHGDFTDVTTTISDTEVLVRPENLGSTRSGGVELVAAGKLFGVLDYTMSGDFYYDEIDAGNLGFDGKRSTVTCEGKAALNWRLSARNRAQFNLAAKGRQLTAQGYREGSTTLDLGYRFQYRPDFAFVATMSDVFDSRRDRTVLDSAAITARSEQRQPGRIAFIGFSWSLAADKNPEQFEYDK